MSSLNKDIQDDIVHEGKLLSSQEREAFKMISTGNDLHGQRALALLAIDKGATQEQAGQRAGLTGGQVKYWLGKFRQVRMDIFPKQVLKQDQLDLDRDTSDQGVKVADQSTKSKKAKKSQGKKRKKKNAKKSKTKKGKKSKNKKSKKNKRDTK